MKKSVALLVILCMGLLGVTGCSSKNQTSKSDGASVVNAGKTLRIMMSSGDAETGTITPAFEKAAEIMGITIEYDIIPAEQMLNVLNTQLVTGNSDDVILHNYGLTDVSAKDLEPLSGEWTGKITSTTKPLCMDESGNFLKAPLGGESNMGLLYNKKVLETCDVTMPIKNYEGFIVACDKIKKAGYTPVYVSNKEVWTAQILLLTSMTSIFANDSKLVNEITTNKIEPVNIPELKEIWENVASLKALGYINRDYMSASNDMAFRALANGNCAFYAQMDNSYATLMEQYPEQVGDIGMSYTPIWDDYNKDGYVLFDSATNYLSVVKNSPNKELAKEFVNTMISQKILTVYYENNPGSVPYENLGYELKTNPFNKEMQKYAKTMPRYGTFNNNTYNGATPLEAFYGAFSEQIQGLIAGQSVEDAMNAWYDAYSADAKARGAEGF